MNENGVMTKTTKPAQKRAKTEKVDEFLVVSSNFEAIQKTISALRTAGRLELVDSALVETARHLARMCDEHPENASLWKEYRAAETTLRSGTQNENDGLADLAKQFDAALRDEKN
jgi:hypothetical protein